MMDFDNLFDRGHNRQNHNYDQHSRDDHQHAHHAYHSEREDGQGNRTNDYNNHRRDDYYRDADYTDNRYDNQHDSLQQQFLGKLQSNPNFKLLLIIVAIIILGLVVMAAIVLFPLIIKLLKSLSENGARGVIDTIWNGVK